MDARAWWREKQKGLERFYHDLRQFRPGVFATRVQTGRTGCRFLLHQYQSRIPRNASAKLRSDNLRSLALGFKDILIQPGQIFSFFRIFQGLPPPVRPRPGPHFCGDHVMNSGECGLGQLASALHALALLAQFEIIEHHAALIPLKSVELDYIPMGLEAWVNWPERDLRFRNSLPFDVAIQVQVTADHVFATLYGKEGVGITRTVESEEVPGIASELRVRVVRKTLEKKEIISTEVLGEKTYRIVG